jgi:hypothetical protein
MCLRVVSGRSVASWVSEHVRRYWYTGPVVLVLKADLNLYTPHTLNAKLSRQLQE